MTNHTLHLLELQLQLLACGPLFEKIYQGPP